MLKFKNVELQEMFLGYYDFDLYLKKGKPCLRMVILVFWYFVLKFFKHLIEIATSVISVIALNVILILSQLD
jgi:hypothetical protein